MGFVKLKKANKNDPYVKTGLTHGRMDTVPSMTPVSEAAISRQSSGSQAIQQKLSDRIQMKKAGTPIQRAALEEEELQMKKAGSPIQRAALEEEELQMKKAGTPVQRAALEEEELQMKKAGTPVQRAALEEEELQMKKAGTPIQRAVPEEEELQLKRAGAPIQREAEASSGGARSDNQLPANIQSKMENSFQTDFSDVKIHSNSSKATDVGALAYTQGTDIHFAPGQYNPESTGGQELLGHELTHVVQQKEGTVKATTEANGMPVNDDPKLEKEADERGKRAASS